MYVIGKRSFVFALDCGAPRHTLLHSHEDTPISVSHCIMGRKSKQVRTDSHQYVQPIRTNWSGLHITWRISWSLCWTTFWSLRWQRFFWLSRLHFKQLYTESSNFLPELWVTTPTEENIRITNADESCHSRLLDSFTALVLQLLQSLTSF
jgi:hypothetical protein